MHTSVDDRINTRPFDELKSGQAVFFSFYVVDGASVLFWPQPYIESSFWTKHYKRFMTDKNSEIMRNELITMLLMERRSIMMIITQFACQSDSQVSV